MKKDWEMRKVEILNKIANRQFKKLLANDMKSYYELRIRYERVKVM